MMRLKLFTTIAANFQSVCLKKNKPFADRKRLVFFVRLAWICVVKFRLILHEVLK